MKSVLRWVMGGAAVLIAGAAGYYWSLQAQSSPQRLHMQDPPSSSAEATPPVAPPDPPSAPAIKHPIDAVAAAAPKGSAPAAQAALPSTPEAADSAVANALADMLGRKEVQSFLSLDGFIRHAVATVDNLPGKHAATRLWPVQPVSGKLQTEEREGGTYLAADNAARYEAFVHFVETVDLKKAVALYVQFYPLFQQAYQELGYPDKYFNDRLVAVIDHLLDTPEVTGPLKVVLPEVKGPMQPERPWVMYEFEDYTLDERSAGQKILLRMGPDKTRRLKVKLKQLRQLVTHSGVK